MTEQQLKQIEETIAKFRPASGNLIQELIDEVRFLQAALADARKESVATKPSSFGSQLIEALKIRAETDPGAPAAIIVRAD